MIAAGGGVRTAEHADRDAQRRAKWLWLLVVVQLLIPASYYVRGQRDDERFAWRMFSVVRVQRCRVRASAIAGDGAKTAIDLEATLHSAWVRALERGRVRVIEQFLRRQCSRADAEHVELRRNCEDAARRASGRERFSLRCADGSLTRESLP